VKSQVLRIWSPDSNWRDHVVIARLNVHNVAPDSEDTPYLFTFHSASSMSFEQAQAMMRRRFATEPVNLTLAINEQEKYLRTGIGGKKVARFMLMVIWASSAFVVAPCVVGEDKLQELPSCEDVEWVERARQSLQVTFFDTLSSAVAN
jgi:hypothetical protein